MTSGSLKGRRVLVTGAGGFLGEHLVRRLAAVGAHVTSLDLKEAFERSGKVTKNTRQIECDITDYPSLLRTEGVYDFLVHLAAVASPQACERHPDLAFKVNVQGTFNVLRLAKEKGVGKFVLASSGHVYGVRPRYLPMDENHPLALVDTYNSTKALGESLCRLFYENYGLKFISARVFSSYGPGQTEEYFIPSIISKARQGRIELSGMEGARDFVYVDDVIEAFLSMLVSDYVGEVNVGTGRKTELGYVARYIADAFGAVLTRAKPDTSAPTSMQCDTRRAERVLGWKAGTSIEAGLDMTIRAERKS